MRRYAIFLIAIPAVLVFSRLGVWQLSRLHQRRALNSSLRAAMSQPPIQLGEHSSRIEPFRTVRGAGRFDYQRQLVVEDAVMEGIPGVIVVTPLVMADSTAVLVERGWVRSPGARAVDLDRFRESDSALVDGVTVDPGPEAGMASSADWPKHVQRPSPQSLAGLYPYRILPYVVRRTNPPQLGQALRPVPLPELSEGPHLGYAFQWFAFAVIALVGSFFIYRREEGRGKREE